MTAAVFLDRDGVINELVGCPQTGQTDSSITAEQVRLRPGAGKAIRKLHEMGYKVVIISTQIGIARGDLSWETFEMIRDKMREELAKEKAFIDREYYFFHPSKSWLDGFKTDCSCKPEPGILREAAKDMNIELSHSLMIGDKISDIQAGKEAGCHTVLLGKMKCEKCREMDISTVKPDEICQNLPEVIEKVITKQLMGTRYESVNN